MNHPARTVRDGPQASADPLGELAALEAEEAPRPKVRGHGRRTDPCETCGRGSGDGRMAGMVGVLGLTGTVFFLLGLVLG